MGGRKAFGVLSTSLFFGKRTSTRGMLSRRGGRRRLFFSFHLLRIAFPENASRARASLGFCVRKYTRKSVSVPSRYNCVSESCFTFTCSCCCCCCGPPSPSLSLVIAMVVQSTYLHHTTPLGATQQYKVVGQTFLYVDRPLSLSSYRANYVAEGKAHHTKGYQLRVDDTGRNSDAFFDM